ncbi:MAG: YqeG family HAD IIIA-type phosphatase [Clostridia bacterium]|nr:YqeG family HAD IIIA-type phosphatase [Clostridia bacterium]
MLLMPQFLIPDVSALTEEFLKENGIRGIIFDIDNTLVGFRELKPTEANLALFARLREQGIQYAIASNNNKERVGAFAEGLGISAYHRACKPLGFALAKLRKEFGLKSNQIALVGDQIYTDMLGGNLAGMITVLVEPIDQKETVFFKIKRALEIPVVNRKRRKDAEK